MFSANENILLRQHKKRVVEYVESTIPENVLDLGINVMAMQVTCVTPGCVPIETAIIIIFPKLSKDNTKELLPGLPESAIGGSYKTKILKPLVEVTQEDVLDALPPSFMGGTKSVEKLCYQIRDDLLAQITQLFDDDIGASTITATGSNENNKNIGITTTATSEGNNIVDLISSSSLSTGTAAPVVGQRQLVAQYIQQCLQEYIDHNCIPPEIGQPYPERENNASEIIDPPMPQQPQQQQPRFTIPSTGNFTIPRPMDHDTTTTTASSSNNQINENLSSQNTTNETVADITNATERATTSASSLSSTPQTKPSTISLVNSSVQRRQQALAVRDLQRQMESSSNSNSNSRQLLAQIAATGSHARGIRRPGCPCCDPDNASTIVDQYLSQT